jgi:hypothetical protein
MLARLKGSSGSTDRYRKTTTENVSVIDVEASEKSNSSSWMQTKSKTVLLVDEENSRPAKKIISLEERRKKEYPFRKDKIEKLFKHAVEKGVIQLPLPKRPNEVDRVDDPNYCIYHRCLGHKNEDCWIFLDQLLRLYEEGKITFSKSVLKDPQINEANFVQVINFGKDDSMEDEKEFYALSDDVEEWATIQRKQHNAGGLCLLPVDGVNSSKSTHRQHILEETFEDEHEHMA